MKRSMGVTDHSKSVLRCHETELFAWKNQGISKRSELKFPPDLDNNVDISYSYFGFETMSVKRSQKRQVATFE